MATNNTNSTDNSVKGVKFTQGNSSFGKRRCAPDITCYLVTVHKINIKNNGVKGVPQEQLLA